MSIKKLPRLLIGASQSGAGKTSITLSIVAALCAKGLKVQTFKVGPDYLDPTYLSILSGRACYNLDGWMMGREYVVSLFNEKSSHCDISIIEGVMGLFDGAQPDSVAGSSAEIAIWLQAPTILILNAHGMAGSIAAIVKGFSGFVPDLPLRGVLANYTGSDNHKKWLENACSSNNLAPVIGAFPRGAFKGFSSRRLGLVTASDEMLGSQERSELADIAEANMDIQSLLKIAGMVEPSRISGIPGTKSRGVRPMRLGIAMDEAFHFYYQDNLEALEGYGFELVRFSPLKENTLPEDLDFLYIGGGYPEEYAQELARNIGMFASIGEFAASQKPVYAECGGLMYLSRGMELDDGSKHEMAGLFPAWTRMRRSFKALRYCEVTFEKDSILSRKGGRIRGHEFHYSEIADFQDDDNWQRVYSVKRPSQNLTFREGFQRSNILLSYIHLHFASSPEALDRIASICSKQT